MGVNSRQAAFGAPAPGAPHHRCFQQLTRRGHNFHIQAFHGDFFTGFRNAGVGSLAHIQVGHKRGGSIWLQLHAIGAVVEKVANRKPVRQLGGIAHVIAVIVRDNDVVQLLYAGFLDRSGYAVRLNVSIPSRARIHQQCFSAGGHKEGGLPALRIDEVDVQRFI